MNLENPPAGKSLVDAAIAQVVPGTVDPAGTILQLGRNNNGALPTDGPPHEGTGVAPRVGLAVAKSGRSTGLTCSRIDAIDVAITVEYQKGCGTGSVLKKRFTNQVTVAGGEFSAQGDSGSLIVTQDTADPVALLYAGSDTDTIGNPVGDILNAFADPASGEKPIFVGTPAPHPVAACSLAGPIAASTASAPSASAAQASASNEELQQVGNVKDRVAPQLLSHPEVEAVGTGSSLDEPGKPAILVFVAKGQHRSDIPSEVDGIRTRMVENEFFAHRGNLNRAESAELEREALPVPAVMELPQAKLDRARRAEDQHVDEIMHMDGVQGVGVTSSADSPGDAAVMIFVERGVPHAPIPATINGIRTRVRESSRFQAGFRDAQAGTAASCSVPSSKTIPPSKGKASISTRRKR
jgi:hypothetical protein